MPQRRKSRRGPVQAVAKPLPPPPPANFKTVNLALQGGGAHGAFTWGVLDRLLEDDRLRFEGISATSAGAMNAAVLAYGLSEGGRDGARRALADFWRRISHAGAVGPLAPTPYHRMTNDHSLESSPGYLMFDLVTRLFSPYEFNPFNYNPLREALEQVVDFERLRKGQQVKLFLSATNVRTGKVKVFTDGELTAEAVLASACLPLLFQAVEIDGENYWDGGYMGNPAIFPLIYSCQSCDVVVVHINPLERKELPRTAHDILNRINEISFNSSLMREMRAIAFVSKLIDDEVVREGQLRRVLVHSIEGDAVLSELGASSKYNPDWEFLSHLQGLGRECADRWLAANFDRLNRESTVDVRGKYL